MNDNRNHALRLIAGVLWQRLKEHPLARVGPGLITGVADDDPSGIATYSQAGAQFGLNMLWTMPLAFPLMAAIQSMCARIGRVTGKGLAANIKAAFPAGRASGRRAAAARRQYSEHRRRRRRHGRSRRARHRLNRHLMTAFFVIGTLLLQVFVPYHRYVSFLKWLTLSLLAYAAVLFTVHVPWGQVALRTVWPRFTPDSTPPPWWSASSAPRSVRICSSGRLPKRWRTCREAREPPRCCAIGRAARAELRRIRWDTWSGMLYSDVTAYFIILATAVTLHVAGITDINTAAQAASAFGRLPATSLSCSLRSAFSVSA